MTLSTSPLGRWGAVGILGLMSIAAVVTSVFGIVRNISGPQPDPRLTGLYVDFATKKIDPRNLAYSPQYPLWSDGATKRRWIYLPPGAQIDASDPDVWGFPKGTKVWKEFSFGGRRMETRLIESLGDGEMRFVAYAWNADESDAALVPPEGLREVAEIRPGIRHDIPSVLDCQACHVNRRAELLGFSALQLSPDRDPGSPNAERVTPDMMNLATLITRGLIRSYPEGWKAGPPRPLSRLSDPGGTSEGADKSCRRCLTPTSRTSRMKISRRSLPILGQSRPLPIEFPTRSRRTTRDYDEFFGEVTA
jgi:hypothetical protein